MLLLVVGFASNSNHSASAATKVMWGKTELKLGQIGKVTILENTKLVKVTNGSLENVRTLKKGEEFRVYSYKNEHGGLYGVGGGSFVQKNTAKVKYETPSKSKLALLENQTASPINGTKVMWGKTELKKGQIGKVTILADTRLVKLENGSLSTVRNLKKGEEFRVYTYKSEQGGLYGVGGGSFLQKSSKIKYETPSKSKLALLEKQNASREYKAALESAKTYANIMHMSKARIYDQLVSEYGGNFPPATAQYAIDNIVVNWKENALKTARVYADSMNMSNSAIYKQLISEYGEKFTPQEAQYAIDNL